MKKEISIRIQKQKKLKWLLISKGYTEQDLRIEALLCFCERILKSFLYSDIKRNTSLISDTIHSDDLKNISESDKSSHKVDFDMIAELRDIHSVLENNILTSNSLEQIFKSAKENKQYPVHVSMLEPYLFYYNYIMNVFNTEIKKMCPHSDNKTWIPELLAINIIHIMQHEKELSFRKFPFIANYDFRHFFEIYNRTNLIIKKHKIIQNDGHLGLKDVSTLITMMEDMSLCLVNSVLRNKYAK